MTGSNWSAIAAGEEFSLGIQGAGAVQAWGFGIAGMTGSDVWHDSNQPTELSAGSWSKVGAGWLHACMIKSDGTLWCVGRNNVGQLGVGDTSTRLAPAQEASGFTNWSAIAAGAKGILYWQWRPEPSGACHASRAVLQSD